MICLSIGLPHLGDPCARCVRTTRIVDLTREDPRVVAADRASEDAWRRKREGSALPLKEWVKLGELWGAAVDEHRRVFAEVWAEKEREVDG